MGIPNDSTHQHQVDNPDITDVLPILQFQSQYTVYEPVGGTGRFVALPVV